MNDKIISLTGRHPSHRRIGIPKVYAAAFLEEANRACAQGITGQRPLFSCGASADLARALGQGFLDIAVLTERADLSTATELTWSERMVWACAPDFTPKPGCPLPLINSTSGPLDQFIPATLLDAHVRFEIVVATADWNARMTAAKAGLGYIVAPRRIIPDGLKVAEESYLPELPEFNCAIHVGQQIDRKKVRPLLLKLAAVFAPRPDENYDRDPAVLAAAGG